MRYELLTTPDVNLTIIREGLHFATDNLVQGVFGRHMSKLLEFCDGMNPSTDAQGFTINGYRHGSVFAVFALVKGWFYHFSGIHLWSEKSRHHADHELKIMRVAKFVKH